MRNYRSLIWVIRLEDMFNYNFFDFYSWDFRRLKGDTVLCNSQLFHIPHLQRL